MGATRLLARAITVMLVAGSGLLATPQVAHAALEQPLNLAPDGATVDTSPVLSWDRVPGATTYDVDVSTQPTFSPILESMSTTNRQAVATKPLPDGELYWRVRAKSATSASSWSTSSFSYAVGAAPSPLSPVGGDAVQPPDATPTLSWTAVPGATGYQVRVGTDPAFVDPLRYREYQTKSTSYLVDGLTENEYSWQVRAEVGAGIYTDYSTTETFHMGALDVIDSTTASPQHSSADQYVEDAVLDWDPVAGAVSYDLQVDTDDDFDSLLFQQLGITGTSYARPNTVGNDQYFWRVRAVDAYGVPTPWDRVPVFTFRRAWPDQPHLGHPGDPDVPGDDVVTDPLYFEWEPAGRLASKYVLELSPTADFATTQRCTTVHTTYVPRTGSDCWPSSGGVWWWRVQGLDGSSGPVTDLISAEVHRFTYKPWSVAPGSLLPRDGYEGPPPTLSWTPVDGAARYEVSVIRLSDGFTKTVQTAATSYTPRFNMYRREGVDEAFRWQVVPIAQSGRKGNGLLAGTQPGFTVTSSGGGTATTPEPVAPANGAQTDRFPTLSWTPLPVPVQSGSTQPPKYQVLIRQAGASAWQALNAGDQTNQAAYEDTGSSYLSPGVYEWMVEAYPSTGGDATSSTTVRTFEIVPLASVTGYRVSLRGGATGTATCDGTLPEKCVALPETPILQWDPVPNAGFYQVRISYDQQLTNVLSTTAVESTMFRPTVALPDSQAGTAYYWDVRACTSDGRCDPPAHATHAFEKLSNQVQLVGPGVAADTPDAEATIVADDVTLSWTDWVSTNVNDATSGTGVSSTARMEADKYRVQVATDRLFSSTAVIDNQTVDQARFTSFDKTYPEGPLWWRVQAVDASGNTLPWSDPLKVIKRSPVPLPTTPASNGVSTGETFSWKPLPFAAAYDVEVYKNGDTNANPGNRVASVQTKQAAVALPAPLPVSDTRYAWRVRRSDVKGRKGDWSRWRYFTVVPHSPTLVSPDDGAGVPPNEALFSWAWDAGLTVQPATYQFQRRSIGATSLTESVTTTARAWAPRSTIADGNWEWQVVALDTAGKQIGESGWQSFHVSGSPVATQRPILSGSGTVGSLLSAQAPTWDIDGVSETWQWYRGGTVITGATSASYEVAAADVGLPIKVRVTGSKAGYKDGVTESDPVSGVTGPAPQATRQPGISGSGKVGTELTLSTTARWDHPDATTSLQWYRGETKLVGETGTTHLVQSADVGEGLTLRVTAELAGYADGFATSNPITAIEGDALVPTRTPSISGDGSVGSTLTAQPGSWPAGSQAPTYQWLRDGVPIPGATSSLYRLQPADAARTIAVRVTVSKPGFADAVVVADGVRIAKMSSTTAIATSRTSLRRGRTLSVTATVRVPFVSAPTGRVKVVDRLPSGRKVVLTTFQVRAANNGTKSVKVRFRTKGKNRVQVVFLGNGVTQGSNSSWAAVTVTR